MSDFVGRDSIVRKIWGDGDIVLLVFAGCAAEFALNRAVDWLFFTGKLPRDPIGRLFATASYAQEIVFADDVTATRAFERIRAVHGSVERQRGQPIPDWAHRDVLYMLIDCSERAHELLVRPLTAEEQDELYDVFYRVGLGHETAHVAIERWITSGELDIGWAFKIDTLTAVMFVVVTTVSALVHVYSIGYMEEDDSRPRFFAYLSGLPSPCSCW